MSRMSGTISVEDLFPTPRYTMTPPGGVRVVESAVCLETVLDTSKCRSPSRALRRYKRGVVGHVKRVDKPIALYDEQNGIMYAHPVILEGMRRRVGQKIERDMENRIFMALTGNGQ